MHPKLAVVAMRIAFCCFALLCASSSADVPEVEIAPGVSMPMLAFGTMQSTLHGCSVQDAVKMWLKLGGRHLDMSKIYGTEKEVGQALKAAGVPRHELFLTAKIEGPIGYARTLEQVAKYDLADIGVTYFDLLLIHTPCPHMEDFPNKCGPKGSPERLDTWRALEHLKATGRARAIGVSNFDMDELQQLYDAGYNVSVNQVQWHLGYHDDALLRGARAHGTHLEAWASMASPSPRYSVMKAGIGLGDARMKTVAARYNASTAQVALQWSVKVGVTPVTGTCSERHARSDLESFDFELSSADVAYLNGLAVDDTDSELAARRSETNVSERPYLHLAAGVALLAVAGVLVLKRRMTMPEQTVKAPSPDEYSAL